MNAYELADELDGRLDHKAANMLRQQADRIAELEKGEEVAGRFYWESVVDGHVMAVPSEGTPHYNKDDFPLYTTPQIKKLSDEEILTIADKCGLVDYRPAERKIYSQFERGELENFARAILRKAQEK